MSKSVTESRRVVISDMDVMHYGPRAARRALDREMESNPLPLAPYGKRWEQLDKTTILSAPRSVQTVIEIYFALVEDETCKFVPRDEKTRAEYRQATSRRWAPYCRR